MSNWIVAKENEVLVNLNELADIVYSDKDQTLKGYTAGGYGIVLARGNDAKQLKEKIVKMLDAQRLG